MIKINLLGDDTVKDHTGPIILASFGASLAVLLLACFFFYSSVSSQLASATEEVQQAETKLARLKERTKEVRDLEARRDELQKMTLAIATLKKSQEGPVRLIDDINMAVPERVWIRSLDVKSGVIKLTGISLNDGALVQFLKQLEQSLYFERVDLVERVATPLTQITTYNSFDGTFNWYVIKGDQQSLEAKLELLAKEAKSLGLEFVKGQPVSKARRNPGALLRPGAKPADKGLDEVVSSGQAGVLKKGSQYVGKPTMYAWDSLQKVDGFLYTIDGRVRYTPRIPVQGSTTTAGSPSEATSEKKPG